LHVGRVIRYQGRMETGVALAVEARPLVQVLPFQFVGTASAYFRIWLVNLALSLVTLGIYSAWAKVRTRRWFYGNTWVGDSSFAYLANPLAVLKGRLLVVAFLVAQSILAEIHPVGAAVGSIVIFLLTPVLIARGLAFRARNTAYRNVRLRFSGTAGQAATAYILWTTLSGVTLGLAHPAARCRQARFLLNNLHLGSTPFALTLGTGAFYRVWSRLALYVAAGFWIGRLVPRVVPAARTLDASDVALVRLVALGLAVLLGIWHARTATTNLIWSNATLGPHRFESRVGPWKLLWLYLGHTVAIVASLGLLIPWASVRATRYRASCMRVHVAGSLDDFVAAQGEDVAAAGDEAADLLDVDMGL